MYEEHKDYSRELESAIAGACMLETTAISRIYNLIKPEHFYGIETKNIITAIYKMFDLGLPVDLLTVCDFLINKMGFWNLNGTPKDFAKGTSYEYSSQESDIPYLLCQKTNSVVSTANLEYHATLIKQMYINREIKRITQGGIELESNPSKDLKTLYNELNFLNEGVQDEGFQDMSQLMVNLYKHQDEMLQTGGKGLQTGFKLLDNLNGGFFNGNTVVIGARPSVGKSAFAGQIALNIARQNKNVGIISLEMNNNEISARIAAIDTGNSFNSIYRNLFFDERERQGFYNRVNSFTSKLPIYISDKTGINANSIRAKASVLKSKNGIDLLIIDYLQLISSEQNKNKNRENEVSEISRACKIMAKELDIPVIVLCQLNRASTHRKGLERYPMLSDLRESGSIEQDADVVMFLHRDYVMGETEDKDGRSTEGDADLLIRKWRNGRLAHIKFDFIGDRMMFQERDGNILKPMHEIEVDYTGDNPF